jgi:hypothetical protein
MILHAIDRGLIHFVAVGGLMLAFLWGIRLLRKKKPSWDWLPERCLPQLIVAGIIIAFAAFIREPFDVAVVGDPVWKSYTDLGSWLAGVLFWPFVIRWVIKLDWS